ncbi:MAG: hypothetical protein ACOX12_05000 [Eggerthellaceae bacterium]|jgi:hypothetical protein
MTAERKFRMKATGCTALSRRAFLALSGVAGVSGLLALAGCSARSDDPPSSTGAADADAGASESATASMPGSADSTAAGSKSSAPAHNARAASVDGYELQEGSRTDRSFVVDNALSTPSAGTVHFSLKVPSSYDGSTPCPLYVHLPGLNRTPDLGLRKRVRI